VKTEKCFFSHGRLDYKSIFKSAAKTTISFYLVVIMTVSVFFIFTASTTDTINLTASYFNSLTPASGYYTLTDNHYTLQENITLAYGLTFTGTTTLELNGKTLLLLQQI